ncbi:MAG TPA: tyrosine-type recombinase/integrase [Anaerolineaceae bacterium]|nr:tyrosine-type recombinase/integrase [Anaerolineaceae bacterium]
MNFHDNTSVYDAINLYIQLVNTARSANTARTYRNGMSLFQYTLSEHKLDPESLPVSELGEEPVSWFTARLKKYSPATERLYLTALAGFYDYIVGENLAEVNLPRIRLLIHQRARRPGIRLPQFPQNDLDTLLQKISDLHTRIAADEEEKLRNLRDRAFLLTLADTGLRVHEACGMRRGDLDRNEGRAIVIGKGNQQAVVRFSRRAQAALDDYLRARAVLDGASGRPLSSLPLFARHDPGAGKKVKPITTATGRNIVNQRVAEFLGNDLVGRITPHSFRHYFVTRVLQTSGNLKLAQELARHKNIAVTQRYAHLSDNELDEGYWKAIEE